jgi:uncharacterized protein
MPRVAALYRYPVKGFTPEACDTLTVLDEGRIAGDRVLGIRFADTAAADEAWSKKTAMVALMNTPGLARLHLRFDAEAQRLHLSCASTVLGIGQQQVPDFIGIRERRGSSTWAGNRQRQFSYFV